MCPRPDVEVVRPYTPVDQSLTASSQETDLFLMVKVYPDGMFSSYLNTLHTGTSLSLSPPAQTVTYLGLARYACLC